MKWRLLLLVVVLGVGLAGCWRHVTLVPADAPASATDAPYVPDVSVDAAEVAPVDAAPDAPPDAPPDSSIDAQ